MNDDNPYVPPDQLKTSPRTQGRREGWLVRSILGSVALLFIAILATYDVRRMSIELWIATVAFSSVAFNSAFVALTGKWCWQ